MFPPQECGTVTSARFAPPAGGLRLAEFSIRLMIRDLQYHLTSVISSYGIDIVLFRYYKLDYTTIVAHLLQKENSLFTSSVEQLLNIKARKMAKKARRRGAGEWRRPPLGWPQWLYSYGGIEMAVAHLQKRLPDYKVEAEIDPNLSMKEPAYKAIIARPV